MMLIDASCAIGRVRSHSSSLTDMSAAFFARPGEMPCAISSPVTGPSKDFWLPSGKVMLMDMRGANGSGE